jgi:hypothetical protein
MVAQLIAASVTAFRTTPWIVPVAAGVSLPLSLLLSLS